MSKWFVFHNAAVNSHRLVFMYDFRDQEEKFCIALVSIATTLTREGFKLRLGSDREVVFWLRVGKY